MRYRLVVTVIAVLIFSLAASSLAQLPAGLQIIPSVGKTKGGAGTDWRSDLVITNLSSYTVTVGVHYFPSATSNTFSGTFAKSVQIGAGRSVAVEDVVGTWFPQYGNSTGFLVILDTTPRNCATSSAMASLIASSRTYNNADPTKTYGQSVPSSLTTMNFSQIKTIIPGIRHQPGVSPGYRTNVGVTNFSTSQISVTITTLRSDNTVAGSTNRTIEALSMRQWSLTELGVSSVAAGGRVEIVLDPSSIKIDPCKTSDSTQTNQLGCLDICDSACGGKYQFASSGIYMAYASKVDNGSGDAEFLGGMMDYQTYNAGCEAKTGSSPVVGLLKKYGIDPGYGATFKKVPRTRR